MSNLFEKFKCLKSPLQIEDIAEQNTIVINTAVAGLLVNRELSIIYVSLTSILSSMSVDSLLQIISKPLERFGSEVIHLSLLQTL